MIQNGINIEKPIIKRFPNNVVISGVSAISSTEVGSGEIVQVDPDKNMIGAFRNENLNREKEMAVTKKFVDLYNASGKAKCEFVEDVAFGRWKKLVNNASFNTLCAITGLDTTTIRLAETPVIELLLPLQQEVKNIARAAGVKLPLDLEEQLCTVKPPYSWFRPSTQQDIEKDKYMEIETIVGEPLREAQRLGVPAPTLTFVYSILKALQIRTKVRKGHLKFGETKL